MSRLWLSRNIIVDVSVTLGFWPEMDSRYQESSKCLLLHWRFVVAACLIQVRKGTTPLWCINCSKPVVPWSYAEGRCSHLRGVKYYSILTFLDWDLDQKLLLIMLLFSESWRTDVLVDTTCWSTLHFISQMLKIIAILVFDWLRKYLVFLIGCRCVSAKLEMPYSL